MKKKEITILIVDDDASIQAALSEAITRAGYKTMTVGRPDEALSLVKLKSIHAAVLDCMLPLKNGVDLAQELRNSPMADAPIIFVSGIFRDKGFASDAIKKTNALDFLEKPIDVRRLIEILDTALSDLIDKPKVALHSLLSKSYHSSRERRKALDYVDEITGLDLPFIICTLMDSESTGHLNIVNRNNDLYGISFNKGKITNVDSKEAAVTLGLLLIQHGFINSGDLEHIDKGKTKVDIVQDLVAKNLLSPHAGPIIKNQQILSDIRKLVSSESMQINFVPGGRAKPSDAKIELAALDPILHEAIHSSMPTEWLKSFYEEWVDHPIRTGPKFEKISEVTSLPLMLDVPGIQKALESDLTIQELIENKGYREDHLYRALHYLAIRRIIIFDESRKEGNLDEIGSRLTNMHKVIKEANPFEVFKYFGTSQDVQPSEVDHIYKLFAKANHPDKLPSHATSELRELNNVVFSIVSDAHDKLMDGRKRDELQSKIHQAQAENQMQAEAIIESFAPDLSQGLYKEVLPEFQKAFDLFPSDKNKLYLLWAKIKGNPEAVLTEKSAQVLDSLDSIEAEVRMTALYHFVVGIYKKLIKDNAGAFHSLQKAIQLSPEFLDARRELATMKGAATSGSKKPKANESFLTQDLTVVVGNLFKKKK